MVKACYRYGDSVVHNGITYLPHLDSSSLLPTTDSAFKKHLKDYLDYSSIPVFLILQNANEVYMHSYQRAVPLHLFYPGSLLGLFESLDMLYGRPSNAPWSISAGARNMFMLPKLNEQSGFKRLRMAYDIDQQFQPRYLTDHWQLFQTIARHKNFSQPWQNEVLFFTKNWLLTAKTDPGWAKFKDYLVANAWQQVQFAISKIGLNLTWEHFAKAIAARNLKPVPYLIDQVKHILMIALQRLPGFKVADDTSNKIAPIDGLQHAITNIYDLKKHIPTVLHISSSEKEKDANTPLYYSLSFPTLLEGLPYRSTSTSTIMIDIRNIKHIIDTLIPTFNQLGKSEASWLSQVCFEYFHVETDPYGEIWMSQQLPGIDKIFSVSKTKFSHRSFCATSQFWRGCVRISQKKSA